MHQHNYVHVYCDRVVYAYTNKLSALNPQDFSFEEYVKYYISGLALAPHVKVDRPLNIVCMLNNVMKGWLP